MRAIIVALILLFLIGLLSLPPGVLETIAITWIAFFTWIIVLIILAPFAAIDFGVTFVIGRIIATVVTKLTGHDSYAIEPVWRLIRAASIMVTVGSLVYYVGIPPIWSGALAREVPGADHLIEAVFNSSGVLVEAIARAAIRVFLPWSLFGLLRGIK